MGISKKGREITSSNSFLARFCEQDKENLDPLAHLKLAQIKKKSAMISKANHARLLQTKQSRQRPGLLQSHS